MTEAHSVNATGSASCGAQVAVAVLGIIKWLSLAATPTFAMMALMTVALGGGAEPLCSAMQHGSLWSGMVPMYLLMGAFHSAPWLRLIAGGRS
jgi:hypothetical protein